MPALATVEMEIYQGEDWTGQVIITDQDGQSLNLISPMQMDMKNQVGQTMIQLLTPISEPEDGEIPEIAYSSDIGMIQVHIAREVTEALPPGVYSYDLFATVDDGDVYAGEQRIAVIRGTVNVERRITEMV